MEHKMRKEINKFKEFLNENSEEKLNISDVSDSENIINIKNDVYQILDEIPEEGDLVLLPDKTIGVLGGIKPNGMTFTDGVDGKTFTSFLHISKYKKIKKI